MVNVNDTKNTKKTLRRPGRTIVLKNRSGEAITQNFNFTGLQNHITVDSTGSHFIIFDTPLNALSALKAIRNDNKDMQVRFVHYRLFFTLRNMGEDVQYNAIRQEHVEKVEASANTNVLHYKLYKKEGKFIGCGDMTIDTKDGLDYMLSQEKGKIFTLSNGIEGTFYRYNKLEENKNKSTTETLNVSPENVTIKSTTKTNTINNNASA